MVSVHPNPPQGQGYAHFYSYNLGGDPISTPWMKITEESGGASVENPSKKIRKPYTITKSRENWSDQEHDKFLEALHLFDRDWKKIEAFVGSKTVIQIRSHAQKYFMKVQKNGTSEHIPPPRPKRKAAHSYPHKAPKKVASQPSEPLSSSTNLNSRYALGPRSMQLPGNIVGNAPLHTWTPCGMLTNCVSPLSKDDFASCGGTMTHNWSSNSNEIAPRVWTSNEENHLVNENPNEKRAMPDFTQVYRFIGNLFDSSASERLKTLKKMDPITVKTVLMLMKNLSANLASPKFENHRMLLSPYNNDDTENDSVGSETPAAAAATPFHILPTNLQNQFPVLAHVFDANLCLVEFLKDNFSKAVVC